MKIYIVRHGETEGNKQGLFQGWLDTPLSELGIKLAEITGDGLKDVKFDKVYASPLKRAYDTAKIIISKNNYPCNIIKEEKIKEVNMGTWEGQPFKGPKCKLNIDDVKLFNSNPFKMGGFENGEKILDVCKRTQDFLKEIATEDDINVLVATHGLALRAMLNFLYEDKQNFWQGRVPYNCCVNIVEFKNNQFKLLEKDKIYYSNDLVVDRYKL